MAGTDISSLLEILQAHFGHVASLESDEEESVLEKEKKTSEVMEKAIAKPQKQAFYLSIAELVFSFKSSPPVVADIPDIFTSLWS